MHKAAVVCHDAGGAEIVSSWLKHNIIDFEVYLEGPARKVFQNKIDYKESSNLNTTIENSTYLICGSSLDSDLERNAIKLARSKSLKSICLLDHWANYLVRFQDNESSCLPDEIWVSDKYALDLAKVVFPKLHIKLIENYYLKDLKIYLENNPSSQPKAKTKNKILYVCEPITARNTKAPKSQNIDYLYNEKDALLFFLENLHLLNSDFEEIKIRPHPSETIEKYSNLITPFKYKFSFGGRDSLFQEINEADIVVGCETMAMVVALIAKKRVISSIPPWGNPCSLPHEEIEHIRELRS